MTTNNYKALTESMKFVSSLQNKYGIDALDVLIAAIAVQDRRNERKQLLSNTIIKRN